MNRVDHGSRGDPVPCRFGKSDSLKDVWLGDGTSTRTSDFSGEFLDRALERCFLRSIRSTRIRHLRFVGLTAAVFIVLGIVVDVLIVGNDPALIGGIIAARAVVVASIIGAIVLAERSSDPEHSLDHLIALPVLLVSAMTCGIVWAIRGELLLHALTALVLVLIYYLFLPLRLVWALGISLVFTVGFTVSASAFLDVRPEEFVQVILYLSLTNILGALASRERNASLRREYVVVASERRIADDLRTEVAARTVAERLRRRLAAVEIAAPEGVIRCTVSIGVIQCRLAHESLDVALKRVDDALYRAKRSGRNLVCSG